MDAKTELQSIAGVEIRALVRRVDGTVIGAVRLESALPGTYAALRRQGWTIARSADEAPDVAATLAIDPVPSDVVLLTRETDEPLIESVR